MKIKFKKLFCMLSKPALIMMYYGVKTAFGILLIGIFLYSSYRDTLIGTYNTKELCIQLIMAAVSLFIQFIIGGLIFDCVYKSRSGK